MATTAVEDTVRSRIRQLRFERGLSLRDLAPLAGLSAATLSRIETGERRLSVAQLGAIAVALEVEVADLVGGSGRTERPAARDGRRWEPVGPERPEGRRVFRISIGPAHAPEPHSHEGHQWLYVLEGRLRLVVEGDDRVLARGEAAVFDTWRPHWLSGVDGPADVLAIFSPRGHPLRPLEVGDAMPS